MENVDRDKSSSTAFLEKVDSTLVAWLIFLVFGGSIISLYYARIHYLPDIEWSSSIVHLAVATFVGGAITLLLALSLLIPGYIWSEFLIYDERLEHAFCIHPTSKDLCLRTLLTYIGLPFWLVLLTSHVVLIFFSYVVKAEYLLTAYALAAAILIVGASVIVIREGLFTDLLETAEAARAAAKVEAAKKAQTQQLANQAGGVTAQPDIEGKEKDQRVFKYVAWFGLSIVLGQISMILIYLLSRRPTGTPFILTTVACGIAVLVSNHFVALHYHRSHVQAIITALVAALFLLVVADRNESFSAQVMSFYGIGDRSQTVDLWLNDEGQGIVNDLKLTGTCKNSPEKNICGVRVLSRLGNEYYLDYNGRRFTLPKSAVRTRAPTP